MIEGTLDVFLMSAPIAGHRGALLEPRPSSVGGPADDSIEALADWPDLQNFIEGNTDHEEAEAGAPAPPPSAGVDLSLSRSLSLPAYMGLGGNFGGMRDMFPLSRHLRAGGNLREGLLPNGGGSNADGPLEGARVGAPSALTQAPNGGGELNARLVSMLAKVHRPGRGMPLAPFFDWPPFDYSPLPPVVRYCPH